MEQWQWNCANSQHETLRKHEIYRWFFNMEKKEFLQDTGRFQILLTKIDGFVRCGTHGMKNLYCPSIQKLKQEHTNRWQRGGVGGILYPGSYWKNP